MNPEEFISWIGPSAQAQCRCYLLPASVVIAQGAIESGWGQYVIGQYNLFGRKWNGSGPYIEQETQEYVDGEYVTETDKFQDYSSLLAAIDDWCILITQEPAYAVAWQTWCDTGDVKQFVDALAVVYATDPDYADKIMQTIHANNLYVYDDYLKGE
jgi:flagellar protein FlgJ